MKAWCSESWFNSILFTKLPETFKKSVYWSSNDEKTSYTEAPAERGQLESVLSNYRSAALLLISSLESQQIQHLEEKNKKALRKSPREWMRMSLRSMQCVPMCAPHLLPCQLLAKAHPEPIPRRKEKRVVLFSLLDLKDFAFNTYFIKPSEHLCPVIVSNVNPSGFNWQWNGRHSMYVCDVRAAHL